MPPNSLTCEPPRPFRPATPIRMTSLAPTTWPDDLVPAMVMVAAVARVVFRKSRRVCRVMEAPPARRHEQGGGENEATAGWGHSTPLNRVRPHRFCCYSPEAGRL